MKKLAILVFLVIFVSSVFASLELDRNIYGPSQNFDGVLKVNGTVDLDEVIKADIKNCGSYDLKEIILYDLLVNSSVYSGDFSNYSVSGSGSDSISYVSEDNNYAFQIDNTLKNVSFNFSENSGEVKIDIGLDGWDWNYLGEFSSWGSAVNSLDYDSSYADYAPSYEGINEVNPQIQKCSDFSLSVDELQNELLIKINAVAKNSSSSGSLRAKIGDETCYFNDVGLDWTSTSCNMTLDLSDESSPINLSVCVSATSSGFFLPEVPPSTDYYFISINKAVYGDYSSDFSSSSSLLKSKINDYYNSECSGDCVVPFKLSGTSFSFDPTLNLFDETVMSLIYDLDVDILEYNLSGVDLDLSYFYDLVTPSSKDEDCKLEIEFLGEDYISYFNVTDAPVPKIEVDSEYNAKNIPITFDGSSSEGGVVSYLWDFGDNSSGSGAKVQHSYSSEGNFTVVLRVKDSRQVESSISKVIKIVSIAEVLESELPGMIVELNDSVDFFSGLNGSLSDFSSGMGYDSLVGVSLDLLERIQSNFSSVKNSNLSSSAKDLKYKEFFDEMISINTKTPKWISSLYKKSHRDYTPVDNLKVPTFSKIISMSNLLDIKNEIYLFNQRNVKGDYDYELINVDFLSGESDYVYVSKSLSSSVGAEVIENLENYSSVNVFSSSCNYENSSNVVLCSGLGSNPSFEYAALSNSIVFTDAFVVPASIYEGSEILYRFDCNGTCDYGYCGDGKCSIFSDIGVNESDSLNSNYCPQDCGKNIPKLWYIVLSIVLVFGILWINFYRGPGNFFDVSNFISFKLFRKKLFMIEKDKIILKTYVLRASREGFNEMEIRKALYRKGWTVKQLDHIYEDIKRQKVYKSEGVK